MRLESAGWRDERDAGECALLALALAYDLPVAISMLGALVNVPPAYWPRPREVTVAGLDACGRLRARVTVSWTEHVLSWAMIGCCHGCRLESPWSPPPDAIDRAVSLLLAEVAGR